MAGEDPGGGGGGGGDDDDDPCPFCGGGGGFPARVTLAKRKLPADAGVRARVGPDDEAAALREAVARQRHGIAELQEELEAERGAAAGAASEAMSMILRLQREKSEVMMEARQYRRYAEERFAHDAAEVAALHDAVECRDATVRSLSSQLRACRTRLLHLGFPSPSSLPSSPTAAAAGRQDHPFAADDDDYPSIQYLDHPSSADVGTPRTHHLLNRMPGQEDDKGVICGSPRRSRHARTLSGDSFSYDCGIALADEFPLFADRDAPDRDESDRVYTVDAVHGVPVMAPWAEEEIEIQKLKARLQALEADRESMRHAIVSMGDEKAQVVLLREIAQQLCKEAAPFPAVPLKVQPRPQPVVVAQRKVVKRQSFFAKFFIVTVIKWIASIFCWRRKSNRIRYPIGLCGSNVGLMLVLDRYPKQRRQRFLKRGAATD
ncbi:myosin-binding protein 7-like [Phragmites australis]|uniref:myosin-binding protein 7-like n=1 Tax=Phragmites australis TaxID=29695 RepID=UPI002D77157D|nr:myosin-binding protein 7-like [Phragmites australis]